jgi:hypothetical protein
MSRPTDSTPCSSCGQREWELHCGPRRCGWHVCRTCGIVVALRRGTGFWPGGVMPVDDEGDRRTA